MADFDFNTTAEWNDDATFEGSTSKSDKLRSGIYDDFSDFAKSAQLSSDGTWVYTGGCGHLASGAGMLWYNTGRSWSDFSNAKTWARCVDGYYGTNINHLLVTDKLTAPTPTDRGVGIIGCYRGGGGNCAVKISYKDSSGILHYWKNSVGENIWTTNAADVGQYNTTMNSHGTKYVLETDSTRWRVLAYDYLDNLIDVTTWVNKADTYSNTGNLWFSTGVPSSWNYGTYAFLYSLTQPTTNWKSKVLTPTLDHKLLSLKFDLTGGSVTNYIDKVEIIRESDGAVVSTAPGNITGNTTIYGSAFDNALECTTNEPFRIKLYFQNDGILEVNSIEGEWVHKDVASGGLSLYFEDALGVRYGLEKADSLYYGKVQLSETKKTKVIIVNQDAFRPAKNVLIEAIEHPLDPLGPAQNTYQATSFCLTESGTYTDTLTVDIPAGGSVDIWIAWEVAADASPGWAFWAVKARGEYSV
jgi:hypothetical protein